MDQYTGKPFGLIPILLSIFVLPTITPKSRTIDSGVPLAERPKVRREGADPLPPSPSIAQIMVQTKNNYLIINNLQTRPRNHKVNYPAKYVEI
jgi:hypothetical protein